jgi:hypothetical protein
MAGKLVQCCSGRDGCDHCAYGLDIPGSEYLVVRVGDFGEF